MWLIIHVGIKLIHVGKKGPMYLIDNGKTKLFI